MERRMRAVLLILWLALQPAAAAESDAPRPLTRAEAVRILLVNRTEHVPLFPNKQRFPDVPPGHADERYLLAAEHYGIIVADPATQRLRPDAAVTRAEFLHMLTLTFGLREGLPVTYADVRPTDWFFPYAGFAQRHGLLPAQEGNLAPHSPVLRDEATLAVATVRRFLDGPRTREEQAIAGAQARGKLNLYVVISTRQLRTVFPEPEGAAQPHLAATAAAKINDLRHDVLNLVNAERAKAGVAPLRFHARLNASAQRYGERMAEEGFFSHVSPTGDTLKDRIRSVGYDDRSYAPDCRCVKGYALAENLARGQRTPAEVVRAWLLSPSHKAAMLNPDYRDTGIGIASGIWVQHFGGAVIPRW